MREPRTLDEKLVYDSVNFATDFIIGFIILLIISIPMFLIRHNMI